MKISLKALKTLIHEAVLLKEFPSSDNDWYDFVLDAADALIDYSTRFPTKSLEECAELVIANEDLYRNRDDDFVAEMRDEPPSGLQESVIEHVHADERLQKLGEKELVVNCIIDIVEGVLDSSRSYMDDDEEFND